MAKMRKNEGTSRRNDGAGRTTMKRRRDGASRTMM
jgi:hypothetical protein